MTWSDGDGLSPANLNDKSKGSDTVTVTGDNSTRATKATAVQNAINSATNNGKSFVFVPDAFLDYDASVVTFDNSVRMIREGQQAEVYDVQAYGAADKEDTEALIAAFAAAEANNGTVVGFDGNSIFGSGHVFAQATDLYGVSISAEGSTPRPVDFFDGALYGFNGNDIHKSTDEGETWTLVASGVSGSGVIERILPTDDGEVLVCRRKSLLKSSGWPNSPSWTEKVTPGGVSTTNFHGWGVDGDGTKFILTHYDASARENSNTVWVSTDQGDNWTVEFNATTQFGATDADNMHFHGVSYDPWDDRFWFMVVHVDPHAGAYWSDNDGSSWTKVALTTSNGEGPTTIAATEAGMVLGSDHRPNGTYRILRRDDTADMEMERISTDWAPQVTLTQFAVISKRDPTTGIVYTGWRTEFAGMPAFISASDGYTSRRVWESSTATTVQDKINTLAITTNGTLAAHLQRDDGAGGTTNEHVIGKIGPRSSPVVADDGAVLTGKVSEPDRGGAVAAGPVSEAGFLSVAVGSRADATEEGCVAIGYLASTPSASALNAVAVGREAKAEADSATALGHTADAGVRSVAVGQGAVAATRCVAVGQNSDTTGATEALAIGRNATATSDQAHAAGINASATAVRTVAIGWTASVSAVDGVAIGRSATVTHPNSVALGKGVSSTTQDQIMCGPRNIETSGSTHGLILESPDGSRFHLTVANDGSWTTDSL